LVTIDSGFNHWDLATRDLVISGSGFSHWDSSNRDLVTGIQDLVLGIQPLGIWSLGIQD